MRRQKLAFEASPVPASLALTLIASRPFLPLRTLGLLLRPFRFRTAVLRNCVRRVRERARCREKLAQRNTPPRPRGTLHFTIAKILCKASVHAQARSRTRSTLRAHTHTHIRGRESAIHEYCVYLVHSEYISRNCTCVARYNLPVRVPCIVALPPSPPSVSTHLSI